MQWLDWLFGIEADTPRRSVVRDVISGDAGPLVRGGLTVCMALLALGVGIFLYGVIEAYSGIRDHWLGVALMCSAAAWCVSLFFIWRTYPRFQRTLRGVIAVVLIWIVALPCTFLVEQMATRTAAAFLIPSIVMMAASATLAVIITAAYQPSGRATRRRGGEVNVRCIACGYSMIGLSDCTCPECGRQYTIDELIAEQTFATDGPPAESGSEDRVDANPDLAVLGGDQTG